MGAGQAPYQAVQECEPSSRVVLPGTNLPIQAEISSKAATSLERRREAEIEESQAGSGVAGGAVWPQTKSEGGILGTALSRKTQNCKQNSFFLAWPWL